MKPDHVYDSLSLFPHRGKNISFPSWNSSRQLTKAVNKIKIQGQTNQFKARKALLSFPLYRVLQQYMDTEQYMTMRKVHLLLHFPAPLSREFVVKDAVLEIGPL